MPSVHIPIRAMTTVTPAKITARPAVFIASETAPRTSPPFAR